MRRAVITVSIMSTVLVPSSPGAGANEPPDRCVLKSPHAPAAPAVAYPVPCADLSIAQAGGPSSAASPLSDECRIDGFDDRCESWGIEPYDGPERDMDTAGDGGYLSSQIVEASPDGGTTFVTATTDGIGGADGYDYDALTFAFDAATGARKWMHRTTEHPDEYQNYAYALAVSPADGTVYALSSSYGEGGGPTGYVCGWTVVALDPGTGEERWRLHDRADVKCVAGLSMALGPGGSHVYVTGGGFMQGTRGAATASYDAATGRREWLHTYVPDGRGAIARLVEATGDGRTVLVAGGRGDGEGLARDFTTLAIDAATGKLRWDEHVQLEAEGTFFASGNGLWAIDSTPDGSAVMVAGQDYRCDENGLCQSFVSTTSYDTATGDRRWTRSLFGANDAVSQSSIYGGTPLRVSPDGRLIYLVTLTDEPGRDGWTTIAYDSTTGAEVWRTPLDDLIYSSPLFIEPALRVSPDGHRVVVSGSRRGETNAPNWTHIATIGYDAATGDQRWIARYSVGNSSAADLAISPDSKTVFVAGTAWPFTANPDLYGATSEDVDLVSYPAA